MNRRDRTWQRAPWTLGGEPFLDYEWAFANDLICAMRRLLQRLHDNLRAPRAAGLHFKKCGRNCRGSTARISRTDRFFLKREKLDLSPDASRFTAGVLRGWGIWTTLRSLRRARRDARFSVQYGTWWKEVDWLCGGDEDIWGFLWAFCCKGCRAGLRHLEALRT